MISQIVIRIYKLVGGNKVKNNRGAKIVVVLTITVTKYLMKGLFDNLVRPLLLLFVYVILSPLTALFSLIWP